MFKIANTRPMWGQKRLFSFEMGEIHRLSTRRAKGCEKPRRPASTDRFFRLVPERVHLRQVRLARRLPPLPQLFLDVMEARLEPAQRRAQRLLGMHLDPAAQVRHGE